MFERILKLQEQVTVTLGLLHYPIKLLTEPEWSALMELCKILKPFEEVTTEMSSEKFVTISKVIVIVRGLVSALLKFKNEVTTDPAKLLIRDLLKSIAKRFGNVDYDKVPSQERERY